MGHSNPRRTKNRNGNFLLDIANMTSSALTKDKIFILLRLGQLGSLTYLLRIVLIIAVICRDNIAGNRKDF
jgi:hypothetical protein